MTRGDGTDTGWSTTAVTAPTEVPLSTTDPTDRRLWSYREIAAHIGVKPETVRSYRKHGLLPPPDTVEGGRPYWFADTVRAWVARRPGSRRGRRD
ncbi:hypothetical protein GCM10010405_24010 [Streptomyces macrosporus]|uniref:HTH merR-type domain-containing protein n=1 Tax=Streptomyces macrosporus TaxID=44032 RepID=A0ABP5WY18_9ACTN